MIDKCPHCGSASGLYSKEYVYFNQYYQFDGEADGYSDFTTLKARKRVPLYCCSCNKFVIDHKKLLEERT